MSPLPTYNLGIDIGSTTTKVVFVDKKGAVVYSAYRRHLVGIYDSLKTALIGALKELGDCQVNTVITGSVGMGISERLSIPFLQEVVASSVAIQSQYPDVNTLIDIGGEDAKLIIFQKGKSPVMRMNGSCAGGTGAFIDQMANLLGISIEEMDALAHKSTKRYSISSRCGVFAKTDIQNLLSRNVERADIAASIFYALANQTVTTLQRGLIVKPKLLFCGGPFTFISYLRQTFIDVLGVSEHDVIVPCQASTMPAWGCALDRDTERHQGKLVELIETVGQQKNIHNEVDVLPALFDSQSDLEEWKARKQINFVKRVTMEELEEKACYLGIDSGSTTTKIVLIDEKGHLLFDHYIKNSGNPLMATRVGLQKGADLAQSHGKTLTIKGSCVTGYGEDLIKKAYGLNYGIVETIAHYLGAMKYNPDVSFILDIGGQDMKAIFVDKGIITRMEVNEACSSGCGSFIESFANSLDYNIAVFAQMACEAKHPCDLGTRCTVFMNSKVKQFLRNNASVGDIAAGLSYSVIKNMLHKTLRIKNIDELGPAISVQGGTFKNLSVVKAMEEITGRDISFTDVPELMGALGCALYAREQLHMMSSDQKPALLQDLAVERKYESKFFQCKACENHCTIQRYTFDKSNVFYSGNKCEKVFNNRGTTVVPGQNASALKDHLIFNRHAENHIDRHTIGIPRVLNMFENYPFWFSLLSQSGFNVKLSDPSSFQRYEKSTHTIMSDNICFPAKLVHGHVDQLIEDKVDRIFLPFVVFEEQEDENTSNSFNCPIVTGYSDVIKSSINTSIPIDSPAISFKNEKLLKKACRAFLMSIQGKTFNNHQFAAAFRTALAARDDHTQALKELNNKIYQKAVEEDQMMIMLVGHPYHHDPLIQHKVSDIMSNNGIAVLTDDIVRQNEHLLDNENGTVMQWQYINSIIKAAHWVARSTQNIHLVQLSSFGCGPDAFIIDEVHDILALADKSHTVLKVDDVTNVGSLRLRIRSLIESLQFKDQNQKHKLKPAPRQKVFTPEEKQRTILIPFFSDFYSPLVPPIFAEAGYKVKSLPPSDKKSRELGLKYVNNEVCYPATLVVGDILSALESGQYDHNDIAVGMTQTGGQCRATNYISLLKKALHTAGYDDIPVVSLSAGNSINQSQPGFKINWVRLINKLFSTLLYADSISKLYYASAPREKYHGRAAELKSYYINKLAESYVTANHASILALLEEAVTKFTGIIDTQRIVPRMGIVGEIFVKYNPQSSYHTVDWIIEQGVEAVVPPLTDFAMQFFVNYQVNADSFIVKKTNGFKKAGMSFLNKLADQRIADFNRVGGAFPHFLPFTDIHEEARQASQFVNLNGDYGEGWLIPAEFSYFAHHDINHVVSLQPFGCIANHIVAKGIENSVMKKYPDLNLLYLDFDSGVSQANMLNRLHFMVKNAKEAVAKETVAAKTVPEFISPPLCSSTFA